MNQNQDQSQDQLQIQKLSVSRSLDAVSFFNELVKEGCRLSLLSPSQLEAIQFQLLHLLTDQINRWTGGQSSSVPLETGQCIQQSVIYTIGYYLKSLPDAQCALEELKSNAPADLFLKGKQLLGKARKQSQKLLLLLQEKRIDTDLLAYNDTLGEGLPSFFSAYDMDFGAHETPASIDYPLGNDKMNLSGIEYIHEYLQKLQLENEFCSYFSTEEVNGLLRGYDRQYKELLFNIYELVLTNAVGCLLLGNNDRKLHLSDYERRSLQQELSILSGEKLDERVDEAVSRLLRILFILKPALVEYIKASAINLKSRLKNALEINGLTHLFLSIADEAEGAAIEYEDNPPLEQGSFQKLADEIRDCRFFPDKIALLHDVPLSITDLTDLLEGSCFFDDEYQELFASLDEIRLALLMKKLPLDPAGSGFLKEESHHEWENSLITFLEQSDPLRKAAILSLSNQIQ